MGPAGVSDAIATEIATSWASTLSVLSVLVVYAQLFLLPLDVGRAVFHLVRG
jgi:hypothetical protein